MWKAGNSDDLEPMPDITLSGQRLYLRPPQSSDWGDWADIRGSNQMRLKPFEPSWPQRCLSSEFFTRRIRRQTREWHNDRAYSFLIFKASNNSLIGGININNVTRGASQYANLGYWIDQNHESQGYMSEALKIILHHCFTTLKLHRIHASCISENESSKKLLLANGFTEEGFAKKYLKINGHWQDHQLFGLCIEDFSLH